MFAKSIIILVSLFGLLCFSMPENRVIPTGIGIAEARGSDTVAQQLVRDLEEALKSGNRERILLAQRRVHAHQGASRILKQRPALQRQLNTAIQPAPKQTLQSQAAISTKSQTEPITPQKTALHSPDVSSRTGFPGTADGMKQASQTVSSQVQGVSKEGSQNFGSRTEGVASSTTTGMGSTGMQGFSSKGEVYK